MTNFTFPQPGNTRDEQSFSSPPMAQWKHRCRFSTPSVLQGRTSEDTDVLRDFHVWPSFLFPPESRSPFSSPRKRLSWALAVLTAGEGNNSPLWAQPHLLPPSSAPSCSPSNHSSHLGTFRPHHLALPLPLTACTTPVQQPATKI